MNFEKLEKFLNEVESEGVPFAGIKVVYKNEIVYEKVFGKCDDGSDADFDDLFFFYSATKVVTAVAAMQLVEQGKLELDAPVYKYIPEFKKLYIGAERVPAENTLTVRHLMSMTSGYGYDWDAKHLKAACEDKNASTLDIVKAIAKDPLQFEPGETFCYGFGLDITAAIIEVITGMRFGEYVKKNIFEPLGMNNSYFKVTDEIYKKILPQSRYNSKTGKFDFVEKKNIFILTDNFESGGAGLISTINDYIKFIAALSNYGTAKNGYKLITPESIDKMREDNLGERVKDFWKPDYSYGLGVRTLINNEHSRSPLGEFGWDSAARSYTLDDVENNLGIFFGCHTLDWDECYQHHIKIRDLVYECLDI